MVSDPVDIANGNSFQRIEDISLRSLGEEVSLLRSYTSHDETWTSVGSVEGPAMPFGSSPSLPESLRWWHSFFAFARDIKEIGWPHVFEVRALNGKWSQFEACTDIPCFGTNESERAGEFERNRLLRTTQGFLYQMHTGAQYVYESTWGKAGTVTHHFLSRILDARGRTVATLAYQTPVIPGVTCPEGDASVTAPGVPYLNSVTTADGARLVFHYKALQREDLEGPVTECVLSHVALEDRSTTPATESTIVTYTYAPWLNSLEAPGLLSKATFPQSNREETYQYTSNGLSISGNTNVTHTYDPLSGKVSGVTTPTENLTIQYIDPYEQENPSYEPCGRVLEPRNVIDNNTRKGDGTNTASGWTRQYEAVDNFPRTEAAHVYRYRDTCTTPACSPGTIINDWSCGWSGYEDLPAHPKGRKDKRGHWETYTYATTSTAASPDTLELKAIRRGATNKNGNSALEETRMGYTYSPSSAQLPAYVEEDSVLGGPGTSTRVQRVYDGTRLKALIENGWTKVLDPAAGTSATVQRHRATFFFTNHACLADANDPLGRTLEVHGPCWVDGPNATDCSPTLNPTVPITQYFYYPIPAPGAARSNRDGKLQRISRFPSTTVAGCNSAFHLDTTYDAYDARGKPTSLTDANGIVSTLEWQEEFPTRLTIDSSTWRFTYDNGKLTSLQYPEGNFEVFCYRTGTPSAACSGGTRTERMQWKARSSQAAGATWSEKVAYTYWPDGTLASEAYLTATSEVRRVAKYAADAHQRPTWQSWGDSAGQFNVAKFFDRDDNLAGIGRAFNTSGSSAPAFCGGASATDADAPQSLLCSALKYDRADRLVSVDDHPTGTTTGATRTCFRYDRQGHIISIDSGRPLGDACTTPSTQASHYVYDDFGNVVEATLPTHGSASVASGTTRYEYNARGDMIEKQTPQMVADGEALVYAYDEIGRSLSATHTWARPASGSERLWALGYDASVALDVSCNPSGANLNSNGRLLYRDDSFGRTFHAYDAFGRIVREIRLRTGTTTCGTTANANPHTTYSYKPNGHLESISYPYGRTVTYLYGTGALTDRVSGLDVTTRTATGWQTTPVVRNALWEPYGSLRGYQLTHPTSGTISTVEYLLGDDGTQVPTGCPTAPPTAGSSDHTGRLRALWVSTGAQASGTGTGDLYKATYTWQADQLVQENTCLAGATTPQVRTYAYDGLLRLTQAGRPAGNFAAAGGAFESRTYGYDGRGNRTALSGDAVAWQLTSSPGGNHPDWLTRMAASTSGSMLGYDFDYDSDGRVRQKTWPTDSSGAPSFSLAFTSGPSDSGATDTVFRSVSVNGATYNYFYDAFGRRRYKAYPIGPTSDEYFHDAGHVLLTDRGSWGFGASPALPVDDYVWLGGRPVAIVRGLVNDQFQPLPDTTADCRRMGEAAACGFYFPITDSLGKPVLMLDGSRRVAGTGEYDPFGHVNRVSMGIETPHPYGTTTGNLGQPLHQATPTGTVLQMRVLADVTDLAQDCDLGCGAVTCGSQADEVTLSDTTAGTPLASLGTAGRQWSDWVTPGASGVQLKLSTLSQCSTSTVCEGGTCTERCDCTSGTPTQAREESGVVVSAYEYRRFTTGASPFWTPLRFPGHYHDAETDLFENWNRYYDPSAGRYFQPEPTWQSPDLTRAVAPTGLSVPAYAYAGNNPIAFADVDGRYFVYISPSLQALVNTMQTTYTGGQIYNRLAQSPVPISLMEIGDQTVSGPGPRPKIWRMIPKLGLRQVKGVTFQQGPRRQCNGTLAPTIAIVDAQFTGSSGDLIQVIIHELTHVDQVIHPERYFPDDRGERIPAENAMNLAAELDLDVALP